MKKLFQTVVRWVIYEALTVSLAFFRILPFQWGVPLGGILGRMAYYLLGRDRRQALTNLSMAFQDKNDRDLETIAIKMFENFGKGFGELAQMEMLGDHIADFVTISGNHHVDTALQQGKGLLWITGHIGNWELMAVTFACLGYPVNVVARSLYDKRIDMLLNEMRTRNGVKTISRGDVASAKEIFRALRRNELLGLLIDQDTRVNGVFVDFFGKQAFTPRGAAEIALRTHCPVVTGFIHRTGPVTHHINVSAPIDIVRTGDWEKDVLVNTQRFTTLIEEEIRRNPDDWVWIHKRWKRRPDSSPLYSEKEQVI